MHRKVKGMGITVRENFDTSLFITFDIIQDNSTIVQKIIELFTNKGFKVYVEEEIRQVKKDYLKKYRSEIFIELVNLNFLSKIEDWDGNNAINEILEFEKDIKWIYQLKEINKFKVILTWLAEQGQTSDMVAKITLNKFLDTLFIMSDLNYNIWTDNLIIEFI